MELSSAVLENLRTGKLDIKSLRMQTLQDHTQEITYIDEPITYEVFFLRHLLPNKPCLLGPWATADWRARKEWVTSNNRPDGDYLKQEFGSTVVPVANCDRSQFSAHPKEDQTLVEYLAYLERRAAGGGDDSECLYLKDWHFTRSHPEYGAYTTPVFFRSDWLNEFWDGRGDQHDDYRFVYFGPKGSWTPLHADVLRSYSWSANVCGTKMWWLYPPGEEENLKDRFGQLAYDLRSPDMSDAVRFPRFAQSSGRLEVTQHAGEVIFVPSGWHHQVFNLEDTISINHNWLNGCSADLSWAYVKACLRDVQEEIADCHDMDGWHQQCQLILKASSGIDYSEFYQFVHLIASNRLSQIADSEPTRDNTKCDSTKETCCKLEKTSEVQGEKDSDEICYKLEKTSAASGGENSREMCGKHAQPSDVKITPSEDVKRGGLPSHHIFDLMQIVALLEDMQQTQEFTDLDFDKFDESPQQLYERIKAVL